jgi:hypothetical protein
MALSLLVLLVPIVALLGFYRLVLGGEDPIAVDPRPAIAEARSAGLFPVAEPVGLGDDWHVSVAAFRRVDGGATLRLGYVDPDSGPVQVVQSSVPPATLIPAELGTGVAARGTLAAGPRTWQRYDTRPGESALVLLEKDRTIVVVGATDVARLRELAATLS